MTEQKKFYVDGKEVKLHEIWENQDGSIEGVILGFDTSDTPLIEIDGTIRRLRNSTWSKKVGKLNYYVYYRPWDKTLFMTTTHPDDMKLKNTNVKFVEAHQYYMENLNVL